MTGTYSGVDKRLQYLFQNAKEVSISGTSQTGTSIAVVTIDGQQTTIKAPAGSQVSCQTSVSSGTTIATLTIDGTDYVLKCPVTSEVEYEGNITEQLRAYEGEGQGRVVVYNEPTYKVGTLTIDKEDVPVYAPPATGVTYESNYDSGTIVGKIVVRTIATDSENEDAAYVADKDEYNIIVPGGGGGGNVDDVYVNGSSVVVGHIARIDLTGYATNNALQSAVDTLEANFRDGVDAIYDACVRKGSTPASHSLTDVVEAIYAIDSPAIAYREANAEVTVIPEFTSTVEVV